MSWQPISAARRKALWPRTPVRLGLLAAAGLVMLIPPVLIARNLPPRDPKVELAIRSVDELRRIDASWTQDGLRLSSGLIADYDPLTYPLPRLARHEQTLGTAIACPDCAERDARDHLPSIFERYHVDMARKIDLVERLKARQSVLGNSLRFLPTACAELIDIARDRHDANGGETVDLVGRLAVAGMDFQREPRPELRASMDSMILRLQAVAAGWPADAAAKVDAVVTHLRLVLEHRQASGALLRELLDIPTTADLKAIADTLQARQAAFSARQAFYKVAIVGYTGFLLALLGAAGWLLARTRSQLDDSHASLRAATDEAQLQLVQSAKMAAMGRMAAGLAHEINTPLAYVRATMAVLKENLVDNVTARTTSAEEMGELFADGIYGIDQITELVLTLKNFTRLDQARVGEFSVEEGLESSLLLARYTLKHIATVTRDYGGVRRISCSPAQMNQVFLNIIVNGAHAMQCRQGKGLLRIRTSEEAGFVRVDISDNGSGIPGHVLPKIFDPFFTTKKIGEGSGTGLALAYRIVESHGGRIAVESREDVGTTFSILLPFEGAEASTAGAAEHMQST